MEKINKIVDKINENTIDTGWDISALIVFQGILKNIVIERFAYYIVQQTGIDIKEYERRIKH